MAPEDEMMTIHTQNGVGVAAYLNLTAAATIADTYFPALASWLISCPSSKYLLKHLKHDTAISLKLIQTKLLIFSISHLKIHTCKVLQKYGRKEIT